MMYRMTLAVVLAMALVAPVSAADLGVHVTRLTIFDRPAKTLVTYATHRDVGIQKGPAGPTSDLGGSIEIFYTDASLNRGRWMLSQRSAWKLNDEDSARFEGGARVDDLRITNGKRLKLKALALGDNPAWTLNLSDGAPSDTGGITTVVTITNATDNSVHRMCTRFSAADGSLVVYRPTRDGGHKLVARHGIPVSCDRVSYFRMEPDLSRGFFSLPWPNDIRHKQDGSLDMTGFPLPPNNPTAESILSRGSEVTTAFGTNAAIFFQVGAPIDPASFPSAEASTQASSPVMLVNLDDPAAARVPVLLDWKENPGQLRPPDLLSILPYPGHPLEGATRYAAILFEGLETPAGTPFVASPLLAELAAPWDTDKPVDATRWAALQAQRDAVYAYVDGHTAWSSSQVVAFTVFTTQDVTSELRAIAAAIEAMPQPTPLSRNAGNCSGGALRATVSGQVRLPHWQAGSYPYLSTGGEIVVVDGKAVQQGSEDVLLSLTYPCGPAPANGWPILIWMSGTGGGASSSTISQLGQNSSNPLPYVVASVAPLYSGDRYVSGLPFPYSESEFVFFNYFNALAARTNQLQQTGDLMYLRRIAEGIVLSAAETGNPAPVQTDDSIEVVAGHSQGALTVPHVLAVDPSFDAGFSSEGGGGLYQTILHRSDVRLPLTAVIGSGAAELDMFHPLVHAVQTFAEVGDAANYGRFARNAHIVSTSGLIDGCSPVEAISIIGTALGLEIANPLYYPVYGTAALETPVATLPVMGNLADGRTGITVQMNGGHYIASSNPALGRSFVESLAEGGVPMVDPGVLVSDDDPGCPRFDPLP